MEEARRKAEYIKGKAIVARSKQRAAWSNTGAVVGVGSTQSQIDTTTMLSEADQLAALYTGINYQINKEYEARYIEQGGRNNMAAAVRKGEEIMFGAKMNAVNSVVGAATKYAASGYKMDKKLIKSGAFSGFGGSSGESSGGGKMSKSQAAKIDAMYSALD